MRRFSKALKSLRMSALTALVARAAAAVSPPIDESHLLARGFKMLAATTTVQQDGVQRLPSGKLRPTHRRLNTPRGGSFALAAAFRRA